MLSYQSVAFLAFVFVACAEQPTLFSPSDRIPSVLAGNNSDTESESDTDTNSVTDSYSDINEDTNNDTDTDSDKDTNTFINEDSDNDTITERSDSDSEEDTGSDTTIEWDSENTINHDSEENTDDSTNPIAKKDTDFTLTQETDSETESEFVTDSQTEIDSETESEFVTDSQTEIDSETESEFETDTQTEIDSETESEFVTDTQTEIDSETESEFETDTQTEIDSDTESEETDTQTEIDSETESAYETDTQTKIDSGIPYDTDTETGTDSETETETETETDYETDSIIETFGTDAAYQAAEQIVVDGRLNEDAWQMTTPLRNIVSGELNDTILFDALWTRDYFYIGLYTNDQALKSDPDQEAWMSDSVDILIDGNNNGTTVMDQNDDHCIIVWNNPDMYCWIDGYESHTGSILHAWHTLPSGGYSVEVGIPWSRLNMNPVVGDIIGFDIGVNDADGIYGSGRDSQIRWHGATYIFWHPEDCGDIHLKN